MYMYIPSWTTGKTQKRKKIHTIYKVSKRNNKSVCSLHIGT